MMIVDSISFTMSLDDDCDDDDRAAVRGEDDLKDILINFGFPNTPGGGGKKSQKKVQKFHGGLTKPYLAWRWL